MQPSTAKREYGESTDTSDIHSYMSLVSLMLIATIIVILGSMFLKVWFRINRSLGQRLYHTIISIVLFGDNEFVTLTLTHTGTAIKSLSMEGNIAPSFKISQMWRVLHVNWADNTLKREDGKLLVLPSKIRVPLLEYFKANRIINNLKEIQIQLVNDDEHAKLHMWITESVESMVRLYPSMTQLYSNPSCVAPATNEA